MISFMCHVFELHSVTSNLCKVDGGLATVKCDLDVLQLLHVVGQDVRQGNLHNGSIFPFWNEHLAIESFTLSTCQFWVRSLIGLSSSANLASPTCKTLLVQQVYWNGEWWDHLLLAGLRGHVWVEAWGCCGNSPRRTNPKKGSVPLTTYVGKSGRWKGNELILICSWKGSSAFNTGRTF